MFKPIARATALLTLPVFLTLATGACSHMSKSASTEVTDPNAAICAAKESFQVPPHVPGRTPAQSETFTSALHNYTVKVIDKTLKGPWAVVTAPDGRLFVLEHDGPIHIYGSAKRTRAKGSTKTVALTRAASLTGIPADFKPIGQGGMMDFAFDPAFATNGFVYLTYTTRVNAQPANGANTRISRFKLDGLALKDEKILAQGAYGTDSAHFGSRLAFGQDGKLYASFGERHNKEKAQDLRYLNGKTIRINTDGTIPNDNPFVGRANALTSIYTLGHRNPQGLAAHPTLPILASAEHGPTGYDAELPGVGSVGKADEVNILTAGGNYGWPVIFGSPQTLPWTQAMKDAVARDKMIIATREYTAPDGIAPSGIAYYSGTVFPSWDNDLFVAALRGYLVRLKFAADGRTLAGEEVIQISKTGSRVRDVTTGIDGLIYVVTDLGELVQISPN